MIALLTQSAAATNIRSVRDKVLEEKIASIPSHEPKKKVGGDRRSMLAMSKEKKELKREKLEARKSKTATSKQTLLEAAHQM